MLAAVERGDALEMPQDEAEVTYAPPLTREDGRIDWSRSATLIHDQVRGLHPWPHAFTSLAGARLIVLETAVPGGRAADAAGTEPAPGALLSVSGDALAVVDRRGRAAPAPRPGGRAPAPSRAASSPREPGSSRVRGSAR